MVLDGLPTGGDSRFHVRWVDGFTAEIWNQHIWPRWLDDDYRGLGGPVFYFYPPLGYAAAAALGPPAALTADLRLVVLALALRFLSGAFCYLWLARVTSGGIALAGAFLYVAAPYHLIVDLYIRTSYAELWGFVWLPLMLYSCERLRERPRTGFVLLAVVWAALVLSHLPSAIVAAFVPFAYALASQGWVPARWLQLLGAMGLGLLLAAFALLPALMLLDEVGGEALLTAQRPWAESFLSLQLFRDEPAKAGVTALNLGLLAVVLATLGVVRRQFGLGCHDRWLLGTGAVGVCAGLMTTSLSTPLWWLPVLPYVQFPWRFNLVLSLALSGLSAGLLPRLASAVPPPRLLLAGLGGGLLVSLAIDGYGLVKFWPDGEQGEARVERAYRDIDVPQHLPLEWLPRTASAGVDLLVANEGPKTPVVIEGEARVLDWSSAGEPFRVEATSPARIVVPRFHFIGVDVRANGDPIEDMAPYGPLGLVSVELPPGRYEITIAQRVLAVEWWGLAISGLALAVLVLILASSTTAARLGLKPG